jgi:H+/Cl- antiporter ClcA
MDKPIRAARRSAEEIEAALREGQARSDAMDRAMPWVAVAWCVMAYVLSAILDHGGDPYPGGKPYPAMTLPDLILVMLAAVAACAALRLIIDRFRPEAAERRRRRRYWSERMRSSGDGR